MGRKFIYGLVTGECPRMSWLPQTEARLRLRNWVLGCTLGVITVSPLYADAERTPADASAFIIRDVRLFDGVGIHEHRSVLFRNGVVALIGGPQLRENGASVVEGSGRTLIPGVIDAHVHVPHVDTENALIQSARLGVTTVLDLFTDQVTLKRIKEIEAADAPGMADVRTAGVGATVPKGHPTEMGGGPIPTVNGLRDAVAFVDARAGEGSDFIKIILEDGSELGTASRLPTLDPVTLGALVREAHRLGKIVVVHAQSEAFARMAIDAGADGLAHLFLGDRASADFGRFAASRHVFVIPTLTAEYSWCARSDGAAVSQDHRLMSQTFGEFTRLLALPKRPSKISCNATDQALIELKQAGVPILVGTDAAFPGSTYGASTLDELGLLVAGGLTPIEALIAGTSAPAHAFHLRDRGEIRVGKRADLVLVEGDPTRDIDSVKNIVAVWKRGALVPRLVDPAAERATKTQR